MLIKDYLRLKECIGELVPSVRIELIAGDNNLYKLGFADEVMCTIKLNMNDMFYGGL